MTIRDYCNQARNYEYSQEYFRCIKECMELDLIDHFIQTQSYIIQEHAGDLGSIASVSYDQLQALYEETEQKKIGILKRIWHILKNVFNAIVRAFRHGSTKYEDIEKDRQKVISILDDIYDKYDRAGDDIDENEVDANDEELSKITDHIRDIATKWYNNSNIKLTVDGRKDVGIFNKLMHLFRKPVKEPADPKATERSNNYNIDNVVSFSIDSLNKDMDIVIIPNNPITIIPINDLIEISKIISDSQVYMNAGDINAFLKLFRAIGNKLNESEFVTHLNISIDHMRFEDIIKHLSNAQSAINSYGKYINTWDKSITTVAERKGKDASSVSADISKQYAVIVELQKGCANLLSVYNEMMMLRSHIVYDTLQYLKKYA